MKNKTTIFLLVAYNVSSSKLDDLYDYTWTCWVIDHNRKIHAAVSVAAFPYSFKGMDDFTNHLKKRTLAYLEISNDDVSTWTIDTQCLRCSLE